MFSSGQLEGQGRTMDANEVKRFANVARNRHPMVASAFENALDSGAELLVQWGYTLRDVPADEASKSLLRILSGERQFPERTAWSLLPKEIADDYRDRHRYQLTEEARRAALSNDDSRYRCHLCRDLNMVVGWNRNFVREAEGLLVDLHPEDWQTTYAIWKQWKQSAKPPIHLHAAHFCCCEQTDERYAERGFGSPRFRRDTDFVFVWGKPKEVRK